MQRDSSNTTKLARLLMRIWRNDKGQDLIEYALLAAFLTVAVAGFFPTSIAPNITAIFSKLVVQFGLVP